MNTRRLKKAWRRICQLPKNKYFVSYLANKIRHIFLKLTKSTRVAYPSTVMLELTNHCNLHCTTCPREYAYGKEMAQGTMNVNRAKKIIDELCPYLDSIGLTGMGETFLYKEIDVVVDYIKRKNKGIIISVSTNAMVPDFINIVSQLINKIDTIQISIDGLGDVYESIRKNADFKQFDKNVRQLAFLCKNTTTDLMFNMVITKDNFLQMPLLVKYAEEVGIKYMDFTLFNLASITNIEKTYYTFYQSTEFLKAVAEMDKTIIETPNVIVTNRNFRTDNGFRKCPFPWTHFYICQDGFIAPCCAKPFPKELNFGNVFNNHVIEVLNSTQYRNFRQLWFANKTPSFCNKCHFIYIEPIK
jgi:radical SAM protein with 4Fe4S-binding SPASM domain